MNLFRGEILDRRQLKSLLQAPVVLFLLTSFDFFAFRNGMIIGTR
jgi:hypothetical protein